MQKKSDKILIVGANSGIGKAVINEINTTFSQHNIYCFARKFDTTNPNLISGSYTDTTLIENTLKTIEPDIVIVCIGKGLFTSIKKSKIEDIEECIDVSFKAVLIWLTYCIKYLKKDTRIGYISSALGLKPFDDWSFYCAAKAGVEMFIDCLIREVGDDIVITRCYPGPVSTSFFERANSLVPDIAITPSNISKKIVQAILDRKQYWTSDIDSTTVIKHYEDKNYC